jgi:plastocyanin domain-containing protein
MMGKLMKTLLALTLSGAAAWASSGCKQESPAATAPAGQAATGAGQKAAPEGGVRQVSIQVTEKGYEPSPITLQKGQPVELTITRTTDHTCATEVILEEHDINVPLPLNQPVKVSFTPEKAGELTYGCAMGKMISGVLKVE